MNVGMMCKQVPVYLPHELLGFKTDDLKGTLLTISLLAKLNRMENEANKEHNQQSSSRMNKFKSNK